MKIEQSDDSVTYSEDYNNNFTIEDSLRSDKTCLMEIEAEATTSSVWLDPLTVRIMIEQLQKIQKLQEE